MRKQFGGHDEKPGVSRHRLEVLDDAEAVRRRGAELIAEAAREAVSERGHFALAVSGGRDPWPMFSQLEDVELPLDGDRDLPGGRARRPGRARTSATSPT